MLKLDIRSSNRGIPLSVHRVVFFADRTMGRHQMRRMLWLFGLSSLFWPLLALAADTTSWTVTGTRGTAIYLNDDNWQEISPGQSLVDPVVRTLRSGHLDLTGDGVTITIGPRSVVQIKGTSGLITVAQYVGSVQVSSLTRSPVGLVVRAGALTVGEIKGSVSIVAVNEAAVQVIVSRGNAAVRSTSGERVVVGQGQFVSNAEGLLVARATPPGLAFNQAPDPVIGDLTSDQSTGASSPNNDNTGGQGPAGGEARGSPMSSSSSGNGGAPSGAGSSGNSSSGAGGGNNGSSGNAAQNGGSNGAGHGHVGS